MCEEIPVIGNLTAFLPPIIFFGCKVKDFPENSKQNA